MCDSRWNEGCKWQCSGCSSVTTFRTIVPGNWHTHFHVCKSQYCQIKTRGLCPDMKGFVAAPLIKIFKCIRDVVLIHVERHSEFFRSFLPPLEGFRADVKSCMGRYIAQKRIL